MLSAARARRAASLLGFGDVPIATPTLTASLVLVVRAGLMNTLAAGDSYRDLVWWWRVPVGFNEQKRGSRPITAGTVHAHWFSPSSRERAAKRPFRVSLSFLLDVARFTVVIILALSACMPCRRGRRSTAKSRSSSR
jgi:hypothetical protein